MDAVFKRKAGDMGDSARRIWPALAHDSQWTAKRRETGGKNTFKEGGGGRKKGGESNKKKKNKNKKQKTNHPHQKKNTMKPKQQRVALYCPLFGGWEKGEGRISLNIKGGGGGGACKPNEKRKKR